MVDIPRDIKIPEGLTAEDLDVAEDMVLDWSEKPQGRAVGLVVKLLEFLEGLAAQIHQKATRRKQDEV